MRKWRERLEHNRLFRGFKDPLWRTNAQQVTPILTQRQDYYTQHRNTHYTKEHMSVCLCVFMCVCCVCVLGVLNRWVCLQVGWRCGLNRWVCLQVGWRCGQNRWVCLQVGWKCGLQRWVCLQVGWRCGQNRCVCL